MCAQTTPPNIYSPLEFSCRASEGTITYILSNLPVSDWDCVHNFSVLRSLRSVLLDSAHMESGKNSHKSSKSETPYDCSRKYDSSIGRVIDQITYLSHNNSNRISGEGRRPWDRPPQHLNELGPRGHNYYRVTQSTRSAL